MTTRRKVLQAAAVAPALASGALPPATSAAGTGQQRRELIGAPASGALPFSAAVRYGGLLFLSGNTGEPGTGITTETRQALENIRSVLETAGSSLDRVLKVTVFLADIDDYDAMNEVYSEFFGTQPPARSTLAASALAGGARVEIEAIAAAT
jgi:2-iminobutanoate/2-iminopropanoate deaminase